MSISFTPIDIVRRDDFLVPRSSNSFELALWVLYSVHQCSTIREGDSIICNPDDLCNAWLYWNLEGRSLPASFARVDTPSEHELMLLDPRGVYKPLTLKQRPCKDFRVVWHHFSIWKLLNA